MKSVHLPGGYVAFVDDDLWPLVRLYTWHVAKSRNTYYAWTNVRHPEKEELAYTRKGMHQLVMGTQLGDGQQIDHVDGNGLNNQRSNLRFATTQQNMANRQAMSGGSSSYKGVHWDKRTQKWRAQISVNGKQRHLGVFTDELEAAQAYDKAALEAHGEFARLNVKR